MFFGDPESF